MEYLDIIEFWFDELGPDDWFTVNARIDQKVAEEFSEVHKLACQSRLSEWRRKPHGRLAEIIVLDEFSRFLYRNSAKAFSQDFLALKLAKRFMALKMDRYLSLEEKTFLYLPFIHSEDLHTHEQILERLQEPGLEFSYEYERRHVEVLEHFGRYPQRNSLLGRVSTDQEIEYLHDHGLVS
jgi:uncharacterized protein (DUF924 family)